MGADMVLWGSSPAVARGRLVSTSGEGGIMLGSCA